MDVLVRDVVEVRRNSRITCNIEHIIEEVFQEIKWFMESKL